MKHAGWFEIPEYVTPDYRLRIAEISLRGQQVYDKLARKIKTASKDNKIVLTGYSAPCKRISERMQTIKPHLNKHSITKREITSIRKAIEEKG